MLVAYAHPQQPVAIPEAGGEPEPDAAIVLRPMTAPGKPTAVDVSCVVEVAGSSLERDRTTKLRHYARGGIPQYLIINLAERSVEEYLGPNVRKGTYARTVTYGREDRLDLHLGKEERLSVKVGNLMPPADAAGERYLAT